MDYYHKLRIAPNASRKEIEEAYQRLLKESRYDTSIDRREIENAYKILSDLQAKAQYDTRQTIRMQKTVRAPKKSRREFGIVNWVKSLSRRQLLVILAISLAGMLTFYNFRFGYLLQNFQAGDVLFDRDTHAHFGKILQVQPDHAFGSKKVDAYQIELDPATKRAVNYEKIVWLPQDVVKARCYKKEAPRKK